MSTPRELYGQPWREREYIIALNAYLCTRGQPRHINSPHVVELATLLGRTPASIIMRFENFAHRDPAVESARIGLCNIGPAGNRVFDKWYGKPEQLAEVASVLVREQKAESVPTLFEPEPVRMPNAFGKYELGDCLGEGGFGIVFDCVDIHSGSCYAIKIIRTDRLHDRQALHRFRQEIRSLRALQHSNIVRMYEDNLDEQTEFPGFVMDLGVASLATILDNDEPQILKDHASRVAVMMSVVDAVQAMHNGNPSLIHRDINPNNVLLMPDGKWVLADFGLVGFMQTMPDYTSYVSETRGWGTGFYAAPEQYRCFKDSDERSDVYSLGMLVWRLFSNEVGVPDRQEHGLPPKLAQVFGRATQREKQMRYPNVAEFRHDLQSAIDEDRV